MALRFRKSIKLAPGIRWNFSGSGSSFTFGPRGASVNFGSRGTYLNSGIPGLGLYSRERIGGGSTPRRQSAPVKPQATTSVSMKCGVADDGTLFFTDPSGAPVGEHLVELAKQQNRAAILGLIEQACDDINGDVEALGKLHHDTPNCKVSPAYLPAKFDAEQPPPYIEQRPSLLQRLLPGQAAKVGAANTASRAAYEDAMREWRDARRAYDKREIARRTLIEALIYKDVPAMELYLEESLSSIVWPRETSVAFDIRDAGQKVLLDVDLPEVEDMPSKQAAVPARGLKLSVKDLSATKVQKLYLEHVHGIVFRLVGETFAALPTCQTVVASGYSQRRDKATGQLQDEYLLSVRVNRSNWSQMDFPHLTTVDVTEALARHEMRKNAGKSGVFKVIEPFDD